MQYQDDVLPLRRRREVPEELNPEGGLTRASRAAPREAIEHGAAQRLRQARPPRTAGSTGRLGGWLRDPGNLRRAMLLQIILGPPKALSSDEVRS